MMDDALVRRLNAAVCGRLDDFANTRRYTDAATAVTYSHSSNQQWAAEAVRIAELRDLTWEAVEVIYAEVEAGTRPVPTELADFEADLPELTWGNL